MVRIEAAGQRPERRHDDLARRRDEAAARDLATAKMDPELGVEMAGDLGARLLAPRFVAEDDAAKLDLFGDAAAAMIGEARIVVADDPAPVEARGESRQQAAGAGIESVAAESVVETVAEAVKTRRAGALDLAGQRRQRRM